MMLGLTICGAGLFIYSLLYGWKMFQIRKAVLETPTTPIGELTEGKKEIVGHVSGESGTVISPLAGQRCVWYYLKVVRTKQYGRGLTVRSTIIEESVGDSCLVVDGTGTCRIRFEGLDLSRLAVDDTNASGFLNDPSEREAAILEKANIGSTNFVGMNKKLNYYETVLQAGDPFYALGHVSIDSDGMPTMAHSPEKPLMVFDKPEDELLKDKATGMVVALIFAGIGLAGTIFGYVFSGKNFGI